MSGTTNLKSHSFDFKKTKLYNYVFFSLTCRYEFFDAKKNYNDLRQYWPLVVWFYSILKNTKLFFIISYQSYTQGIN